MSGHSQNQDTNRVTHAHCRLKLSSALARVDRWHPPTPTSSRSVLFRSSTYSTLRPRNQPVHRGQKFLVMRLVQCNVSQPFERACWQYSLDLTTAALEIEQIPGIFWL